jgi:hypothetical protein
MRTAVYLAASLAFGACGTSDGAGAEDGPLVSVADATSQTGAYDIALLAHEPTLTRGSHTLELIITSATDGSEVDGLALKIVPWMPAMGHGTAIVPSIAPLGSGVYEIDDANLFMPGLWELRTSIAAPSDYAAPSVQVD